MHTNEIDTQVLEFSYNVLVLQKEYWKIVLILDFDWKYE